MSYLTCINMKLICDFSLFHNFQMSLYQVGTQSQSLVEISIVLFNLQFLQKYNFY